MLPRVLAFLPLFAVPLAHAQEPDLAKIRKAVEAARKASPVPGLALAIVKDGKPIFVEGFGWADVARKKRVTADTVFEIGSCTKSFTALLTTQAQAEGRLSLKDRPSKYLPGFRLKDPEANARITLEDMLSHRSGLPRTDLVWYASDFSRDDLMRVAAEALLAKAVEAQGGAAAIRRHTRYVAHYHGRLPSDAIALYGIVHRRDAVSEADFSTFYSLDRRIGEAVNAVDGRAASEWTSFTAPDVKTGAKAADARLAADLLADVEPKRAYRSLEIVREDKVGDTPVWVLVKTPFAGAKVTDYVSKADFRVLRRTSGSGASAGSAEFSDFRTVDGQTMPFRTTTTTAAGGKTIVEIDTLRFDEYVPGWPWRVGS